MGILDNINYFLNQGANAAMSELDFLEAEIKRWIESKTRKNQIDGENYYLGEHDILDHKRQVIGEDGTLVEIENLPNNKIVDNQYALRVDQKSNYLIGKPISIKIEDEAYNKALIKILNKAFNRKLKSVCKCCLNGGVGYFFLCYKDNEMTFKIFPAYEILPFWKDREHTDLESFIRMYQVEAYNGRQPILIDKVEYYTTNGVKYYVFRDSKLIIDNDKKDIEPYLEIIRGDEKEYYNWQKIPLIPFRYNENEIPLLNKVRSLQDGINRVLSTFQNNMQEDNRNTILVLVNYDGENLGEFRRNLSQYGAVKVTDRGGGSGGDVRTLTVEVNCDNYKAILSLFKKALIENAKGFDSKDDRMSGNPNQMNIQSIYNDIDLDANGMETEFQASLEQLLWFINLHFENTGVGKFDYEDIEFIFNRDVLINKSALIEDLNKSVGLLSEKTLLANHPLVTDVEEELKRKKAEREEIRKEEDPYDTPLKKGDDGEE